MMISARRAAFGVGILNVIAPSMGMLTLYTSFGISEYRDRKLYWLHGAHSPTIPFEINSLESIHSFAHVTLLSSVNHPFFSQPTARGRKERPPSKIIWTKGISLVMAFSHVISERASFQITGYENQTSFFFRLEVRHLGLSRKQAMKVHSSLPPRTTQPIFYMWKNTLQLRKASLLWSDAM